MTNTTQPLPHAGMVPEPKKGDWVQENVVFSGNNCDCSSTCWFAYCCACCLLQRNYNRNKLLSGEDPAADVDGKCGLFCCVEVCTSGWLHMVLPTYLRRKIRRRREIKGNMLCDLAVTTCCLPCSLNQEALELSHELDELKERKTQFRD